MTRDKVLTVLLCGVAMAVHPGAPLWGAPIPLANASFESPAVAFVSTQIDGWQKTPKPESYDESDGFLWSQLTGLFRNTPAGSADHIDNCDGNQAIWVFAVPGAGLFQESSPSAGGGLAPQTLTGSFEVGRAYQLSAGVIGMGGGMSNGVTLGIGLYYRDAASNQVVVAEAIATNSPAVFSNRTHLVEFRAELPTVRTQDPWANQPIGIRLLSTVGAQLQGGYWDLDNIRLREIRAPVLGL
ncbi:MAG TPA: hypothetical protein DCM86_14590, partial [Verrucomicrobiales bacterium]|nr:hypothetical protein [Verrucomicrobiales bacterium]